MVARLAHAMAMESPKITAEVIQAQEFQHLARQHAVRSVPKTIFNNVVELSGAVPEPVFLDRMLTAVGRQHLLENAQTEPNLGAPSGPVTRL